MKIQPKPYLYYMTSLLCSTASLSAGGLYLYELSTIETSMAGAGWAAPHKTQPQLSPTQLA